MISDIFVCSRDGQWPTTSGSRHFLRLLAAVLALALRKNQARLRYRLWLAASLKFLLPFSLLISLGSHLATLNRSPEAQPGFYFVIQKVSQPFTQTATAQSWLAASVLPLLPEIIAVTVALRLCHDDRIYGGVRWRRVAAADALKPSPMSQGREVNALRHLERLAGIRRPIAFWMSRSTLEPGIFGIIQPVLLWPAGDLRTPSGCAPGGYSRPRSAPCTAARQSGRRDAHGGGSHLLVSPRWFGGWERAWLRNVSGPATKK